MARSGRVAISLAGVSKSFAGVPAVNDVTLDIAEGEFFSLLGPSVRHFETTHASRGRGRSEGEAASSG